MPAAALASPLSDFLRKSAAGQRPPVPQVVRDVQRDYGFGGKLPRSVATSLMGGFAIDDPSQKGNGPKKTGLLTPATNSAPETVDLRRPEYADLRNALERSAAFAEAKAEPGLRIETLSNKGMNQLMSPTGGEPPSGTNYLASMRTEGLGKGRLAPVMAINADALRAELKQNGPNALEFYIFHELGHLVDLKHAPGRDIPALPERDRWNTDRANPSMRATREMIPELATNRFVLSGEDPGLPVKITAASPYYEGNSGERFANAYAWSRMDPEGMDKAAPGLLEKMEEIGVSPKHAHVMEAQETDQPVPSDILRSVSPRAMPDAEGEGSLSMPMLRAPNAPDIDTIKPMVGPMVSAVSQAALPPGVAPIVSSLVGGSMFGDY